MKKLYLDRTKTSECISMFIKDVEIVNAGTTIYSMSLRDKNEKYQRFADKYDIHFIFDDNIPQIDFYTIPHVDIMATDSKGGYIGTIGQLSDLESDAAICYIDNARNCYLIAENGNAFLKNLSIWKTCLKEYKDIIIYDSKSETEKAVDFIDIHKYR